jgi:soluble lytic murein transglycosylase-like protein
MPRAFVDGVQQMIQTYWLTPVGKGRFLQSVEEAASNRYTPYIVRTMLKNGLPAQFFYLAMQESNFNTRAIGPPTRWGRAKGMWQFIPRTALQYGLDPGPYADKNMVDPHDERHDFRKSTDAAARYLYTIYGTLAQASGLLVVASYNWGEDRVTVRLDDLAAGPQTIPKEALDGIPQDPRSRNYWRFLGEYRDRMPDETKDYVLKIFAASVIGEDPRAFGLDMDNPLERYLEQPDDTTASRDG